MRALRLAKLYLTLLPLGARAARVEDLERIKELVRVKFPTVRQLSPDALAKWLADPTRIAPALFDARSEAEYAVSHLRGAVRLDSANLGKCLSLTDKTAPMVLYCAVGYRSSAVAARLGRMGFTNVFNLEGSIFQWAREGRALFRGDREVGEVHPFAEKWRSLTRKG